MLLTAWKVAQIISEVTGKRIKHVKIPMDTFRKNIETMYPDYAQTLVEMETEFAANQEAIPYNGEFERLTGRKPITFREWAEKNKKAWV